MVYLNKSLSTIFVEKKNISNIDKQKYISQMSAIDVNM